VIASRRLQHVTTFRPVWLSSLTGEVRGYTGEASVVFCSTSTAAEVAATIRSLASALSTEEEVTNDVRTFPAR
jgi:hypothetical protein